MSVGILFGDTMILFSLVISNCLSATGPGILARSPGRSAIISGSRLGGPPLGPCDHGYSQNVSVNSKG